MLIKATVMRNGNKIGYESGAYLFNKLSLTTLIPRDIEITTNCYDMKLPAGCHLRLRKPPTDVTNENWQYLQFIDLVRDLPDFHTDTKDPECLLVQYAKQQQLDALTLIFMARRHYPQKTVLALIDLLMECRMKLHQDRDAFEALISDVSEKTGIRSDIVEKDYYLTLLGRARLCGQ